MTLNEIAQVYSQRIGINQRTLKNRLVMGPMSITAPTKEGAPSDQTVALFGQPGQPGAA